MRHYGSERNRFLRILLFILALFIATPAMADSTIFRNFVWGASKDDVRQFESAKFYKEEGDSLFFVEQPDDFRRLIRYDSKDGKLWGARYEYQELFFPNANKVLDRYADEEFLLEKLYGKPLEEKFIWKDRTYRNFPQFWARALFEENLRIETVWQVNDTRITLYCYYDGAIYQLYYTLELAGKKSEPDMRGVLGLPATQKTDGVSKP